MDFLQKNNATLQIGPEVTAFSLSQIAVSSQRRFPVPAETEIIVSGALSRRAQINTMLTWRYTHSKIYAGKTC